MFVSKAPISKIPALVQIMAWHRPGNKPLSEPMMVSLLMHVCVTGPQWVNWLQGIKASNQMAACMTPDGIYNTLAHDWAVYKIRKKEMTKM